MKEQVYKKKGRKYIPIGYSDGWSGFPSDGLWLVQTKPGFTSSECIIKIDELESIKPAANLILEYKGKIIKYLQESDHINMQGISPGDFVLDLLKQITK